MNSKLSDIFNTACKALRDLILAGLSSHLSLASLSISTIPTFSIFSVMPCCLSLHKPLLLSSPLLPPLFLHTLLTVTHSLGSGCRFSFFWTPILTFHSKGPFDASSAILLSLLKHLHTVLSLPPYSLGYKRWEGRHWLALVLFFTVSLVLI